MLMAGASFADITKPTTDFSTVETGEIEQGGKGTHFKRLNSNAFSHSSANLKFDEELNFKIGNGIFKRIWVSAPASTKATDGLGPIFNAKSCQRCHLKDGRGHVPEGNFPDDTSVSMFLRLSIPPQTAEDAALIKSHKANVIPEPTYGGQLQDFSIQGHSAEGRMHITYEEIQVTLADGTTVPLRKPSYSVTNLAYGPMHDDVLLSPRVSPQMLGLGLLEAIDEKDILANVDIDDINGDGISGKASQVWSKENNKVMLGRFGWKAGEPTLNQQNSHAFNGDIGLSTPLTPNAWGDCTINQSHCQKAPSGNSPQYENLEVNEKLMEFLLFYTRNLALPARRNADDAQVLAGKEIFYNTGCINCHTPKFVTSADYPEIAQREQLIWPYSDLLLHDMGPGLADGRPEGVANGNEWRTPPLWGIGLTEAVNGHTNFLHDGRARNMLEAILWHGGEAEDQKQAVMALTAGERVELLAFLNSL